MKKWWKKDARLHALVSSYLERLVERKLTLAAGTHVLLVRERYDPPTCLSPLSA
jgi:hypothetical protein